MNEIKNIANEPRCPGMSYTNMLEADTRTPPDYLFEETVADMGDDPISVDPYISEEFARLEREKLWPNVWLFAAREDELPEPGDTGQLLLYNSGRKCSMDCGAPSRRHGRDRLVPRPGAGH